jgi:predicted transcriptional regulator
MTTQRKRQRKQLTTQQQPKSQHQQPGTQHKQPSTERSVIDQVRTLMPRRPLLLTEAYVVAERQADKLLHLLDIRFPHVTYDKLFDLPNVEVRVEPSYRMPHFSGMTRFEGGHWQIVIAKNDLHGRRRYTLAHEFKHVLDHSLDTIVYARLGYGDEQRRQAHIEAICQHFAACFLMPKTWVVAAWANGFQDVYSLATHFQVSVTAMEVRLRHLGLLDDGPAREVRTYFRRHPAAVRA